MRNPVGGLLLLVTASLLAAGAAVAAPPSNDTLVYFWPLSETSKRILVQHTSGETNNRATKISVFKEQSTVAGAAVPHALVILRQLAILV